MTPSSPRTGPLRIGTRGSPLALAQAEAVRDALISAHPDLKGAVEIVVIKTTGDKILNQALATIGGKGLFTKEIDEAMLEGSIDIAVHSMKDVPTWLPDGIVLPCMTRREDTRDAFISNKVATLDDLPSGAVVGTAALRRQAQIKIRRPDIKIVTFRGNVQTRLKKLGAGEVDATLLAYAGLKRLGMESVATHVMSENDFLPAVGQGAVGITCRTDDKAAHDLLAPLGDADTYICVSAERAFLAALDGSCRTPIAAQATINDGMLSFQGLIAQPDGTDVHRTACDGALGDAIAIGRDAGEGLKAEAGPDFFAALIEAMEDK